jgi:hypothetical protein
MIKDEDRGKIRNREYASQIRDFSGLRYGKITPTDIDAFLDFSNKLFVFIETKHAGSPLPYGQRLALERICTACNKGGIYSVILFAEHLTQQDIDVAVLPVVQYFDGNKWHPPKKQITVKQAIDSLLAVKGLHSYLQ